MGVACTENGSINLGFRSEKGSSLKMSSSDKYGYLNISELSSPRTTIIGTFDPRIKYFTMASNIGKNLKREEVDRKLQNDWSLRIS